MEKEKPVSRRKALAGITGVIGLGAGIGVGYLTRAPESASLSSEVESLKRDSANISSQLQQANSQLQEANSQLQQVMSERRNLSRELEQANSEKATLSQEVDALEHKHVVYGGGLSLLGPFQKTTGGEVYLRSIFTYGPDFVICTVEDNPEGFIFPTATLGEVPLEPHSFFMFMGNSKIDKVEYVDHEGHLEVLLTGGLDCHTEALTAAGKFGGRESFEPVRFEAHAVDNEEFSLKAFFDEHTAPINNAIFGPEFTFKGRMVDAKVVVTFVEHM